MLKSNLSKKNFFWFVLFIYPYNFLFFPDPQISTLLNLIISSSNFLIDRLGFQGLGNFSLKGRRVDIQVMWALHPPIHSCSVLPLYRRERGCRQYIYKCAWPCSSRILLSVKFVVHRIFTCCEILFKIFFNR